MGLSVAEALHEDVPWMLILAAILLAAVGYADDRASLPAVLRLGAQIVMGALVGLAAGGGWWPVVGALCVPIAVNVVNFMDGINGISSLNVTVWGVVAMGVGHASDASALTVIGAVTAGSALGFLPWNAPTARLFLGDVGSYLFGAMIGVGILVGSREGASPVVLLAPLSIYLADTGATLIRRAVKGSSLLTAHREHVYQRLVGEAGLSHLVVAGGTATLSIVITTSWLSGRTFVGMMVTVIVIAAYLASPAWIERAKKMTPHVLGGAG